MKTYFAVNNNLSIKKAFLFCIGFIIGSMMMTKTFFEGNSLPSYRLQSNSKESKYEEFLSKQLIDEIKVLCMIMTYPDNHRTRADHVKKTWGKRCTKLLFITSEEDDQLDTLLIPEVYESRMALRNKSKKAFLYAHDNYLDDFDWFLKADDDS